MTTQSDFQAAATFYIETRARCIAESNAAKDTDEYPSILAATVADHDAARTALGVARAAVYAAL